MEESMDENKSKRSFLTDKRSYYELLLNTSVISEVQYAAMLLSMASVLFYSSHELNQELEFLIKHGVSSCAAQRILLPTPYLVVSILLLIYFLFRASSFRAKSTDWQDLKEYVLQEEELKDFATGKIVKRKKKLFIAIFGGAMLVIITPFILIHLYEYFFSECRRPTEHFNDHINFFEGFLILTFPTYLFILIFVRNSKGKVNGN